MSETRNIKKPDIRGVTSTSCQDAQIKGQTKNAKYKITPPIIHIIIRTVPDKIHTEKEKLKRKLVSDKVSCVKDGHGSSTDIPVKDKKKRDQREIFNKTRLVFPEMRGGVLYSRCCCLHRDGLQDTCPLSLCQGQPECLVKPWAICPPAKYVRLRHPELYPKTSGTSCTQNDI